ncbi:MAG: Beta,4-galactosyltransferase CpsIVG [Verrucomicrobia bacterium]|nr:Beta,4-galactosyltransferase CpsIVG [Verrucomicrobiota bacterium]
MIFVTVGSDLPFDRLVRVVDEWAADNKRTDVFAQIGKTAWKPSTIDFKPFLEPAEFSQRLESATVVISHAGMGNILSALRHEKPILVMPRRASLREHRNEHQLATVEHLSKKGWLNVALDEHELRATLDRIDDLKPKEKISAFASPELTNALRDFIAQR